MVYIKPTENKEFYRFRLLAFKSAKSDRDFPFIQTYKHVVWVEDEDGKRHSESVVCPVTPHVKAKWNGDPMNDCPICRFANANFVAWKQSGWKDKESARKNRQFGRKFEALIPVYVVNDPVYEQNNGHFRVFAFYDKDIYKQFVETVTRKQQDGCVFNGTNAFDFFIKYKTVEEVLRKGQPNEFIWKHAVLDRMGFTTKAYDLPAITKDAVDDFPFDETYYVGSTKSELQDFYDRFIKVSNDDIPDEDEIEIPAKPVQKKVETVKPVEEIPIEDPIEEEKPTVAATPTKTSDEEDIDALLGDDEPAPASAPASKKEEPSPMAGDPDDLDALLADVL